MSEFEHYVVEAADETYHHTPDEGSNDHRAGLPIIAGPFDTHEDAVKEANGPDFYDEGRLAVRLRADVVSDWTDE